MKDLIAVVGPTASGKTGLAVKIAEKYGGEVVSCDSMQLYRGMDIGTAKPTDGEMSGIPHHLIGILDIAEPFSVSDYVELANKAYTDISSRSKLSVFCGGTGLYIDSFVSGIDFGEYELDSEVDAELERGYALYGQEEMYRRLCEVDAQAASKTCAANKKRVKRALAVYYSTGKTLSEWNRLSVAEAKAKDALYIGLDFENREDLYARIDARVDEMLRQGLLEEAKTLCEAGLRSAPTAGQAIGYKEFYPYFDGAKSLESCVETLKRNSRRYAKRQLTWFRRNKNIKWIVRNGKDDEAVIAAAYSFIDEYLRRK